MSTMLMPDPTLEETPPITREEMADLRWLAHAAVDEIADVMNSGDNYVRFPTTPKVISQLMRLMEVVSQLGTETADLFVGSRDENWSLNMRCRAIRPEHIDLLLVELDELEERISWSLFDASDDRDEQEARAREEFYGGHMARARNARLTLERLCER